MKLKILLQKLIQKIQSNKLVLKKRLRNKILKIRETYNKDNIQLDYKRIINFFKKENIIAKKIGGYFPINFEFDDLDLLKKFEKDNYQISLPVIKKSFQKVL